jgi:hypothetical protein
MTLLTDQSLFARCAESALCWNQCLQPRPLQRVEKFVKRIFLGVKSMLDNWHNFFFVSYDSGGFVTIDKPPLGFWLQVAGAKLIGFTHLNVFLPQYDCAQAQSCLHREKVFIHA